MGDIRERRDRARDRSMLVVPRRIAIKRWNVECFFRIIDNGVADLLTYDQCHKLADKYLIAMVFMYFLRAQFRPEEYTRFNFFAALYLAYDMEEEDDDNRAELLVVANPADSSQWSSAISNERLYLFKRMGYRAVVSRDCCESLMRITNPRHSVWRRNRYEIHAGANRSYQRTRDVCPNCICSLFDESD